MNLAFIKLTILGLFTVSTNADLKMKKFMFVGTYTEKEWFIDGKGEGIHVFSMEFPSKKSLILEKIHLEKLRPNPSFLTAFRKNGKNLVYVVLLTGEKDWNATGVYGYEFVNNRLKLIDRKMTKGTGVAYVAADRKGETLLVANYWSGSIMSFKIEEDGKLTERSFHQWEGASTGGPTLAPTLTRGRQEGPHPHCIDPDPQNRFVYAADLGGDRVYIYKLLTDGSLIPHPQQPFAQSTPGCGPRHIAFDKTGDHLYLACELRGAVTVFDVRKETGVLTRKQEISTLPANFNGVNLVADIHLTDSGRWLYVSNRGHNSLAIFAVEEDGALRSRGWEWTRGGFPWNFELMDGMMLVANQQSNHLALFWVDESSGALQFSNLTFPCPTPVCISFLDVPQESQSDGSPPFFGARVGWYIVFVMLWVASSWVSAY